MRLSEAILLGDSLRTREPATFLYINNDGSACGCAIGGAHLAVGIKGFDIFAPHWPWLLVKDPETPGNSFRYLEAVGARFFGVCKGERTLEHLVDYVRSVEPSCGDCNRFECSCKSADVAEVINSVPDPITVTA